MVQLILVGGAYNCPNLKIFGFFILSPGTSTRGATWDLDSRRRGPRLAAQGTSTRGAKGPRLAAPRDLDSRRQWWGTSTSSSLDLDSQQDVSSQKQELFSQERAARGEQIVCLGDAKHDSPGFTACWCTYAVLVCKLQLYGPMYTIVHNIFTGCCNWTGRLLLDSAQRPGNLKLKYVNHLAVYIRWDRVRPWSQRVLRPP